MVGHFAANNPVAHTVIWSHIDEEHKSPCVHLSLNKKRRPGMAVQSVFAFSVLFLFICFEAKPGNCSEAGCKLLLVGEGLASEFRSKAFEKGVRLVYLNLKIANESYDPLKF